MRTALWLTSLLALLGVSQAYQAWRTSERLCALETADAWSRESTQLGKERSLRSKELIEAQSQEFRSLQDRLVDLDQWRADFETFAAATRTSERLLRAEVQEALADSRGTSPAHAEEIGARLGAALSECQGRLDVTDGVMADLRMRFESNRTSLAMLNEAAAKDARPAGSGRWQNLLGPAVQLSGGGTIGSAVLLPGELSKSGWRTRVLTAWHVVRDIRLGLGEEALIPVMVYSEDGSVREEKARLLCRNVSMDVALLEITSTNARLPEVRLASRERLRTVEVFEPIYAVGCPLGNDPIPTHGQLSDSHHEVEGTNHWMISAPTYIGNSGGGIFHAGTDELIGIFSKIYTHGTLRPTVIPHMGLAVPLEEIYDWLEQEGYASLTPAEPEPFVATASSR
jgi:S1-C subfamily serine protease